MLMTATGGLTASAQEIILGKRFSFRDEDIKTGSALSTISRRTGYYFTYDSKIIDTESRTTLVSDNEPLEVILRRVLQNDSLRFTVIGKHIIISRAIAGFRRESAPGSPAETIRINGRVTDRDTGEPLPFATVAIMNKPRGTISNADGYFSMLATDDIAGDTLSVSYIGFLNRQIPVSEALGNDFTIQMFRDYIPIPEIIVRSQVPQEIIRRSVESVSTNFGVTPAEMWGFYREGISKGKDVQVYSEAVVRIYKASYAGQAVDQVKVERSRKIENIDSSDTLVLRLKAGLGSSLLLDGMKNRYDFMDEEYMDLYNFRMTDIVTIDDAAAYVIEFVQKEGIRDPLFRGSLTINTADYALMQAEFEFHPTYISGSNDTFISSTTRGFNIRPVQIRYRVSYKKTGDRYFLNHVRGDLRFSARKKRSLFNTWFDVFFEMAVTSASTENVSRFDRNEIIPAQTVFSKTIRGYDREFWGNFDFLNPEDDLLKSLNEISIRLSGYIRESDQNLSIIR